MVKIFNAAIGKKNKSWYDDNMLDLTLELIKVLAYVAGHKFYNETFIAQRMTYDNIWGIKCHCLLSLALFKP